MKNIILGASIALLCSFLGSCSVFGGSSSINLHGGLRDLSSDVDSVSEQSVAGAEVVLGLGGAWALEGQLFYAEDDATSTINTSKSTVTTNELSIGARRTFLQNSPVRPYFGLGVNYMDAELENDGFANVTDDGIGGYAHVGALAAILFFQVGLDLRGGLSGAELAGESLDYLQATIFIGFTW